MASKTTTLYSPSGESYETADRTEITRLTALGYTTKKPSQASKPADKQS